MTSFAYKKAQKRFSFFEHEKATSRGDGAPSFIFSA